MNKLLRQIFAILMFRIDWRKLLVFSSFLTIGSVIVQISRLPYPLNGWNFAPSTISTYNPLYSAKSENSPFVPIRQLEVVQVAPVAVSPNSSLKLKHTTPEVEGEEFSLRRRQRKRRRHKKNVKPMDVPTTPPPPPFYANWSKNLLRHIWSLTPHDALVYARGEIENAPLVEDDLDLYAPLFRNVSTFKRRGELIEISIGGWGGRGRPKITGRLNEGPYTLTAHEELLRNTIKVLCNADASERIFITGKDVSLPETTIRNPKRPLRNVGGKRVSQRPILAFFAGNMHGRVRPILLKYWRDKDEDMRIYGPLPKRVSRIMSYPEHMKSSKYCICPMGYEVNSPRIVEAMYYECVPVIIADNFVPPFDEVLDWSAFSVVVAEKDIPQLKEILLAIPLRKYLIMQSNVKMLQKHFHWHYKPVRYDLFHMILHSIWLSRLNQIQIHPSA